MFLGCCNVEDVVEYIGRTRTRGEAAVGLRWACKVRERERERVKRKKKKCS